MSLATTSSSATARSSTAPATPGFEGDVALDDGRIAEVGRVAGTGREEIDAKGKIVTPGFVDIHTHYDGQATWDERLTPSVLAWRHHRRDGQLRRRLRALQTRRPRHARCA